jgi:hypothetical protein
VDLGGAGGGLDVLVAGVGRPKRMFSRIVVLNRKLS